MNIWNEKLRLKKNETETIVFGAKDSDSGCKVKNHSQARTQGVIMDFNRQLSHEEYFKDWCVRVI